MPRPIQFGDGYIATVYMALMATGKREVMTRRSHTDNIQVYIGGKDISDIVKNASPGSTREEKEAIAKMFKSARW